RLFALNALGKAGHSVGFDFNRIDPKTTDAATLVDLVEVLGRRADPGQQALLANAEAELRRRLQHSDTALALKHSPFDDAWWRMESGDSVAARMVLMSDGNERWSSDLPKLVRGLMLRQKNGRWDLTTAN